MNSLLLRRGSPPAIILRVNRRQYYRVLEQANRGNAAPLANLVGRVVKRSLNLYLQAATPQPEAPVPEDEWIPLREATRHTPYSQEYLSLLARTGRLEAMKRGRIWYPTRRAIDAYLKSVGDVESAAPITAVARQG